MIGLLSRNISWLGLGKGGRNGRRLRSVDVGDIRLAFVWVKAGVCMITVKFLG